MMRRSVLWVALACARPAFADEKAPGRGDVRRGSAVFIVKGCARCHAIWGEGGDIGPDLGRTRAGGLTDSELAAAMWNHIPRMWGKMQEEGIAHVAISEPEMADLFSFMAFVRALDEPGDPEAGRRLLSDKRCDQCHTLGDRAGGSAPDLRLWGRYRNPAVWAKLMFEHAPRMVAQMRAQGMKPPALTAREMVDMTSYIRSVSPSGEADLLDPGDPVEGERIFRERRCIGCHSVRGEGGRVGPPLGGRGWVSSFSDVAVKAWHGAPGMRAAQASRGLAPPVLDPQEMAHVISFLFSACYADPPGSPGQGGRVLREKGCFECHEQGVAPSFDKFRGRGTPVTLAQALWNHGPAMIELMHSVGIRWSSFSGEELRDVVAALNAPAGRKGEKR
jgi:cytochrome c2